MSITFSIGIRNKIKSLTDVLRHNAFKVFFGLCKSSYKPKEEIGLKKKGKILPDRFEERCDPLAQSKNLNKVVMELTLRDTLFIIHSKTPVTFTALKDRVHTYNLFGGSIPTITLKKAL